MTQGQRARLQALRENGTCFSEIAALLGMSINTVKSYCRRQGIQPKVNDIPPPTPNCCAHCGKALNPRTKREKRFCSDACRSAWWNGHRAQLNRRVVVQRACASCGALFDSYPVQNRRYCSHPCYISARYGGSHVDESAV